MMGERTGIEWCDATLNPWIGCEKVSPGCAHCYAETLVTGRMGRPGTWGAEGVRQRTSAALWRQPLRWNRLADEGRLPDGSPNEDGHRPRVFCASLADVFEPRPELEPWRRDLFALIEETPSLDWLILTKRPEEAQSFLGLYYDRPSPHGHYTDEPLPNVWVGTSVENARFTWRADVLRGIPAAVRFISAEPLLGSLFPVSERGGSQSRALLAPDAAGAMEEQPPSRAPLSLTGIDWVIVGGESGPGARPFDVGWAREIIATCREHGVAPFVKQLGSRPIISYDVDGHRCSASVFGIRDRKGGDWAEWPADLRVREFPARQAGPA